MKTRDLFLGLVLWLSAGVLHGQDHLVEGRPISAWLHDLSGDEQARARAEGALRRGGTNTIAPLLQSLFAKDKAAEKLAFQIIDRNGLEHYGFTPRAYNLHQDALLGLSIMGTNVLAAIPELTRLFLDFRRENDGISAITDIGDRAVIPLAIVLSTHPDKDCRMGAAAALGLAHINVIPAVPTLVSALSDRDAYVRANAANALGNIRMGRSDVDSAMVVPALARALSDKSSVVREAAADALIKYRKEAKDAIPALLQACKARDSHARYAAATCLAYIDPEEGKKVLPILLKAARDEDWTVANSAVSLIRQIAPEVAAKEHLRTKDPFVGSSGSQTDPDVEEHRQQLEAYRARKLGPKDKEAIADLLHLLNDRDLLTRRWSIEILAAIRPVSPEIIPPLVLALNHPDSDTAYTACRALALLNTAEPSVTTKVIEVLAADPASQAADYALRTIEDIGPGARDAVPALIRALDQEKLRHSAVGMLGTIGPAASNAVPRLLQLYEQFNASDYPLRRSITISLGRIGPSAGPAVSMLLKPFKNGDADAARALCRIDSQYNSSVIQTALAQFNSHPLRFYDPKWIGLLGELGAEAKSAEPILLAAAESEGNDLVRFHAAWSLWRIDPDQKGKVVLIFQSFRAWSQRNYAADMGWGAIGALWQIEPALRNELRPEIISMLEKFKEGRVNQGATTEMKTLLPALQELANDSALADIKPWALVTIAQLNGAGPELWFRP